MKKFIGILLFTLAVTTNAMPAASSSSSSEPKLKTTIKISAAQMSAVLSQLSTDDGQGPEEDGQPTRKRTTREEPSMIITINSELDKKLCQAIKKNDLKQVKELIEAGADTNVYDEDGCAALYVATLFNDAPLALSILKLTLTSFVKNLSA